MDAERHRLRTLLTAVRFACDNRLLSERSVCGASLHRLRVSGDLHLYQKHGTAHCVPVYRQHPPEAAAEG